MPIDKDELRAAIRKAAEAAFKEVRDGHAKESFYAFALVTDEGLMTVGPAANTEEGYARAVAKYGYSKKSDLSYVRWATAEWGYEDAGGDHFNAVYELVNGPARDETETNKQYKAFGSKLLDAMLGALKDLDGEGFFGKGEERGRVTLFITMSDSDNAEAFENMSSKELNPPAVHARFAKRAAEPPSGAVQSPEGKADRKMKKGKK